MLDSFMTDFQKHISERLTQLTKVKELAKKKNQFNKAYSESLVDEEFNEIMNIDDYQTAFLDLLHEQYPSIIKSIQKPLEQSFYEMYRDSEDLNERKYKPKNELIVHKIQVPSLNSDEWQLMYEMKSDDTIFHVELVGWTYKLVAITH